MKPFKAICALILLSILWFRTPPVLADVAPPEFPPGSNPEPGKENTYVRMVSEVVTLGVLRETALVSVNSDFEENAKKRIGVGQARVNAIFKMHNLGTAAESMNVRFPLATLTGDGYGGYPEIRDLTVQVNSGRVETFRIERQERNDDRYPGPWAAFPVLFPAGEDVQLELNYTDYGATQFTSTYFEYLMETGAGWYGTIGSADLIVRLPYAANWMNIKYLGGNGVISGSDIHWHYDNLEPTAEDNLLVMIVLPEAWVKVLIEEENVSKDPQDGEAWGRLGKAYKEAIHHKPGIRCDTGGMQAYQKSLEAYSKAVQLKPRDGLWHAGYADMLWEKISFCDRYEGAVGSEAEKQLLGTELRAALALAPDDPIVMDLDEGIMLEDAVFYHTYVLPLPTVTPSSTLNSAQETEKAASTQKYENYYQRQTQEAHERLQALLVTITAHPAGENPATPEPSITATTPPPANPTTQPAGSDGGSKLCGAALALPMLILALSLQKGRKP